MPLRQKTTTWGWGESRYLLTSYSGRNGSYSWILRTGDGKKKWQMACMYRLFRRGIHIIKEPSIGFSRHFSTTKILQSGITRPHYIDKTNENSSSAMGFFTTTKGDKHSNTPTSTTQRPDEEEHNDHPPLSMPYLHGTNFGYMSLDLEAAMPSERYLRERGNMYRGLGNLEMVCTRCRDGDNGPVKLLVGFLVMLWFSVMVYLYKVF